MPTYKTQGIVSIQMPGDRRHSLRVSGAVVAVIAAAIVWASKPTGNLHVQPTDLAFAPQAVGAPATTRSIVLHNRSLRQLELSAFEIVGEQPRDFAARAEGCGQALASHTDCKVAVAFAPSAEGDRRAALLLRAEGSANALVVPLSGVGWHPRVSVDPSSLHFVANMGGSEAAPQFVNVINAGGGPLEISNVSMDAPETFSVDGSECRGRTIATGGSCRVRVSFRPRDPGNARGVLLVDTSAGQARASLSAETARPPAPPTSTPTPAPMPAPVPTPAPLPAPPPVVHPAPPSPPGPPRLSVDPALIGFGRLRTGETSAKAVRVLNRGASPLQVTAIRAPWTAGLTVDSGRCRQYPLAPGGECLIQLEFVAKELGPWNANLVVDSNGGSRTVRLSADTVVPEVAEFALNPQPVHFGTVELPGSARQLVELSSTGTAPLEIHSVTMSAAEFVAGFQDCRSPVVPGDHCSLSVEFRPRGPGYSSGTLEVDTNAGRRTVPLDGVGVRRQAEPAPRRPGADVKPTIVEFRPARRASRQTLAVTVTSAGNEPLQIHSAVTEPEDVFGAQFAECTQRPIPPGRSCKIKVTFQPPRADVWSGYLRIDTNAGLYTVSLRGQGRPAGESGASGIIEELIRRGIESIGNPRTTPPPPSPNPPPPTGTSNPPPTTALVPMLAVSPPSIDFRSTSPRREVSVRNTGTGSLSIAAIRLDGDSVFALDRSQCRDSLPGGGLCSLFVTYRVPSSEGQYRAVLRVVSNAGTQTVSLNAMVLK